MMDKVIDIKEAMGYVKSGSSLMLGGFGLCGSPTTLLRELSTQPIHDLTTISEDCGFAGRILKRGVPELFINKQIRKMILSFIGNNPTVDKMLLNKEVEVELVPQGILAERIRAAGAGLGGFYSPTGVGTEVAKGKESKIIDGKEYILELPLRADVAFIKAYKADRMGNAVFKYGSMNFNNVMATAADIVILEAQEIVEIGEIEPDAVHLPGLFVDYIVQAEGVVFHA